MIRRQKKNLGEVAIDFNNKGVKLELGERYLDNLNGFDVVFKTPSMRIDSEVISKG